MNFIKRLFNRDERSAVVAKERLQIILAHEGFRKNQTPSFLPQLQKEIIEVVKKYKAVNEGQVKCELLKKQGSVSLLEVNITLADE